MRGSVTGSNFLFEAIVEARCVAWDDYLNQENPDSSW
jgi:hypothetical protein